MKKISKTVRKHYNIIDQHGASVYSRALAWYIQKALAPQEGFYKKIKVNDYQMYVNLKDPGISRDLFIYGTREADQMYIVKNTLKPGTKVLEIGANIGYYAVPEACIIGKDARTIAYEPSEDNCKLLKKNMELNGLNERVEVHYEAVSNRSGKSRFYLAERSNQHTLNPVPGKKGMPQQARDS